MRIEIHSTETRRFGWDKKNADKTVKVDAAGNPIREERDIQSSWWFFDGVPFPVEVEVHAPALNQPYKPGVYALGRKSFDLKGGAKLQFGIPLTHVSDLPKA